MKIIITVCMLLICMAGIAIPPKKTAVICGRLPGGEEDMVKVNVIGERLTGLQSLETKTYSVNTTNGSFYCKIEVPVDMSYITIGFDKKANWQYTLRDFFVGYGDSVYITINKGEMAFTGNGIGKWRCMYELSKNDRISWKGETRDIDHMKGVQYFEVMREKYDSLNLIRVNILEKWNRVIGKRYYDIIYTDVYSEHLLKTYQVFMSAIKPGGSLDRESILYMKHVLNKSPGLSPGVNVRSHLLYTLLYTKAKLELLLREYGSGGKPDIFTGAIKLVKDNYKGILRSKLLTQLVLAYSMEDARAATAARQMLRYVREPRYRIILESVIESKTPGTTAYNFELPDMDGKKYRLSDFKGKVVVISLWITGCTYCRELETEMKKLKAGYDGDSSVVFISIGADRDEAGWRNSVSKDIFTDSSGINLYAKGGESKLLHFYSIAGYPTQIVIDKRMRLAVFNPPRPVNAENKILFKTLIEKVKNL